MGTFWQRIKSRKFLIAVAGIVIFILSQFFGVDFDMEATIALAGTIIAYITGEALVDNGRAKAEVAAQVEFWRQQQESVISQFNALKRKYQDAMGEEAESIDYSGADDGGGLPY